MSDDIVPLEPFELRILAVLAEKEALTPDNYPLSLNALTNGCNQLSSRDPVMAIGEDTVLDLLQGLIEKGYVAEVNQAGARVVKYSHRLRIKWSLPQDKLAVLVLLMLRGAQTAGEIRTRAGRVHEFASVAEVETCLQFLMDKYPPLVAQLPRAPGTKEPRYAHLLAGELPVDAEPVATVVRSGASGQERIAQLEEEVAQLRAEFASLAEQFAAFRKQFE